MKESITNPLSLFSLFPPSLSLNFSSSFTHCGLPLYPPASKSSLSPVSPPLLDAAVTFEHVALHKKIQSHIRNEHGQDFNITFPIVRDANVVFDTSS